MSAQIPGEPSEEELQQYFAQLREAPAQELLMQAVSVLATGAEVKLGRADARLLIDGLDALVKVAAPHMGETAGQLQEAVGQLKSMHVQAERQGGGEQGGEQGQPGQGQAGEATTAGAATGPDQGGQPAGQGQAGGAPTPPPSSDQPKATDKLWIPGRDA